MADGTCETTGCTVEAELDLCTEEKQGLVEGCAQQNSRHSLLRKDLEWSCERHDEPIKFFCQNHEEAACQSCTTVAHQKPCELKDILDDIRDKKRDLEDVLNSAKRKNEAWQELKQNMKRAAASIHNHFEALEVEVTENIRYCMERDVENRASDSVAIKNKADDDIQRIIEERESKLETMERDGIELRQQLEERQHELLTDLSSIRNKISSKMESMEENLKVTLDILDEMMKTIDGLLADDKALCNGANKMITSLKNTISYDLGEDALDHILGAAQDVKFLKTSGHPKGLVGRIDGYHGTWTLQESIDIPEKVRIPGLVGCLSDDEIVIRDKFSGILYTADRRSKDTVKAFEPEQDTVVSCTILDNKTILCGKAKKGNVCLFNMKWEVIHEKEISAKHGNARVYVDVDADGNILAGDFMSSDIQIISPPSDHAEGLTNVVGTIPAKEKSVEGFRALLSGDILVKSGYCGICVIDRTGAEKTTIKGERWGCPEFTVDPLTNTIFVIYKDSKQMTYSVDQVLEDGTGRVQRIITYPMSENGGSVSTHRCVVTPCGTLVTFNGDKLFFYKKAFVI